MFVLINSFPGPQVHLPYDEVVGTHRRFPKWGPQIPRVPQAYGWGGPRGIFI